jgi:hypothetical protein
VLFLIEAHRAAGEGLHVRCGATSLLTLQVALAQSAGLVHDAVALPPSAERPHQEETSMKSKGNAIEP